MAIGGRPVGFDASEPRAETCDDKRQRAPNPSLKLSFCLFVAQALLKSRSKAGSLSEPPGSLVTSHNV